MKRAAGSAGTGAPVVAILLLLTRGASAEDVFVHVEAPAGTQVRWLDAGSTESVVVCEAPCNRYLSTEGRYIFYRPGKSGSKAIELHPSQSGQPIDVTVRGSRVGIGLGIPLFLLGAVTTGMGVKMAAYAFDDAEEETIAKGVFKMFGPLFLVGGAVEMAIGVALTFIDTGTVVKQAPAEYQPQETAKANTHIRTPTWKSRTTETPSLPMMPLSFSTTF